MNIWLLGAGPMAIDYHDVLKVLDTSLTVIGRGENSAQHFETETGQPVVRGGIHQFLQTSPSLPDAAIVSVGVEQLLSTTLELIKYGVRKILIEKPGGINTSELKALQQAVEESKTDALIGYNRRFYASTLAALEMIKEDGGVTSFSFDFTEWSHVIAALDKDERVMKNWLLANSSHVIDMAFHICGEPDAINCVQAGGLEWHPSASIFTGCGKTVDEVPFSYHADWGAPGRWGIDVMTAHRRYIFRPLEQLHVQEIGSVAINKVEIDDSNDTRWKPGLYLQTSNFLSGNWDNLCTIEAQIKLASLVDKIGGRN